MAAGGRLPCIYIYNKICYDIYSEPVQKRYRKSKEGRKHIMKELLEMYVIFARIGGFTFGGGYAMLPMLEKEIVNNKHWAREEELMDYYAIGQCTPGIIAINTATFIGYKVKGIPGAVMATLGVISPSLVIITVIAAFISNFMDLWFVSSAFSGIRACVCVLIFDAVWKLGKKSLVDKATKIIFLVILVIALFTSVSSALLVVAAGIAGVVIKGMKKGDTNKKGEGQA